jgi:hypothetical protein
VPEAVGIAQRTNAHASATERTRSEQAAAMTAVLSGAGSLLFMRRSLLAHVMKRSLIRSMSSRVKALVR